MTTAFTVMLEIARLAGPLIEGVATEGSSTTIVDSTLSSNPDASVDDVFVRGTAFIITDAGGQGAPPENETARVTDYTAASGTITVAPGDFSAAPAAGDIYGVTPVPRDTLIQAINLALLDLGNMPFEDTSLTTAAATREYTIPSAAKHDLRQVWIATSTDRPYDFFEWHYWRQIHNKTTYDLEFTAQPPSGYTIRLVYTAPHPRVTGDSSTINDAVPLNYLIWRGAYHIYRRRLHQEGREDKRWVELMNEAAEYAERYKPHFRLPHYSTKFYYAPDPTLSPGIETEEIPTT